MRLGPYGFGSISPDLENFRDELTNIINSGKYSIPVISSLPTWKAQPGEAIIYGPSSGGHTQYVYMGSAWVSTWSTSV